MNRLIKFIKGEIVLCIAALLAVISMFFVAPSKDYVEYIDFKTLALLFCLMSVVAGWQKAGVFNRLAAKLLGGIRNVRMLIVVLVLLCFFSSMFITNDVALITFVPFTILLLNMAGKQEKIIYTIIMQTVAANLGSMLLPVGNPQNLYLYGLSGMSFMEFIQDMLVIWLASLVMLLISVLLVKKEELSCDLEAFSAKRSDKKAGIIYLILFIICLGTVAGLIPYQAAFVIVSVTICIFDIKLLGQVDYMLLLTFVCFFIFIGNVKAIPELSSMLESIIRGNELWAGIVSSQVISNVPAAILLSGFSENTKMLLWGVDIGGLGTLIASLASLISYKIYIKSENSNGKKYFLQFTVVNVIYLAALSMIAFIMS